MLVRISFLSVHPCHGNLIKINAGGRILYKIFISEITADKTIKITIESGVVETDKFLSNSMSYANFIIENCPNLTTLNFDITTDLGDDAKDYADKLYTISRSFMNEFSNRWTKVIQN
jgi:hypothetical protein